MATSHEKAERSETKAAKGAAKYEHRGSYADDGTERFAVLRDGAFVVHVASEALAEQAIKDLTEADKVEAEAQKARDGARDANKAAGFQAAEKRGEVIAPEYHRFAEQHAAAARRA